ncbi:class I SAM-dependent methyltransferase [Candidatus Woesearchaeota archaeon]|nr:class I SAM-dependent methyltransferase [Candidatus Woesearchaeota archaeon]
MAKQDKKNKKESLAVQALKKPGEIIPFLIMKMNGIRMRIAKNSIFTMEKELSMCSLLPNMMIDEMLKIYNPKSVLDIGSGSGKAIDYFLKRGVKEVIGVEGSEMAIRHAKNRGLIRRHNLNNPLNLKRKFDIIYSFEFIEHIHEKYVENILNTFSRHSDIIVMTAAAPGSHGQGHFNCQPPEYWIEKFGKKGYAYNKKNTERLKNCNDIFADNILVFERKKGDN